MVSALYRTLNGFNQSHIIHIMTNKPIWHIITAIKKKQLSLTYLKTSSDQNRLILADDLSIQSMCHIYWWDSHTIGPATEKVHKPITLYLLLKQLLASPKGFNYYYGKARPIWLLASWGYRPNRFSAFGKKKCLSTSFFINWHYKNWNFHLFFSFYRPTQEKMPREDPRS